MKKVQIDIVSDVACPWCAIGYKRLEQAMGELAGEFAFTIQWHPFQLNPDMPPEGEPILEHLTRKYGRSAEEIDISGVVSQNRGIFSIGVIIGLMAMTLLIILSLGIWFRRKT
jgi:predicted DsbA family dithiol-disulfide isomerase